MNTSAASLRRSTHPMSRGRTARWMLEECGVPYDTVLLEYGTTMKAPDYLAINPMGKVPALQHGQAVVTEVAAICAYLADLFPDKSLAPAVDACTRCVLPLVVLYLKPFGKRRHRQGAEPAGTRRTRGHGGLRRLRPCDEYPGASREPGAVLAPLRRPFHRSGPVCGRAPDLGHTVQHHRTPPGVQAVMRSRSCSAPHSCAHPRSTTHWCSKQKRPWLSFAT